MVVYGAFFKAKSGNWQDRLIGLIDRSKHSHVEFAVHHKDDLYYCYSSHPSQGGVYQSYKRLKSEHWDLRPINLTDDEHEHAMQIFNDSINQGYDWWGLGTTIWDKFPRAKSKKICTHLFMQMLGVDRPETYGMKECYEYVVNNY